MGRVLWFDSTIEVPYHLRQMLVYRGPLHHQGGKRLSQCLHIKSWHVTCTSCDYFWRWDRSTSRLSVTHLQKVENLLSDNGQRLISLWQIVDCWFLGHRPSWAEVCLSLSPLCPECPKCTLTLVPTMHTHSLLLSLSLSLSYTPNLYVPSVPSVPSC